MKPADIQQGHFYSNGLFVREVVQIIGFKLYWRDYVLRSGEPLGSGSCLVSTLATWAECEITPDDQARMDTTQADTKEEAQERRLIQIALYTMSDEDLLQEAKRRNLI